MVNRCMSPTIMRIKNSEFSYLLADVSINEYKFNLVYE